MSMETTRPVSCPHCETEINTKILSGINAEVNPNLRIQVLQETLFNWTCPTCGYSAQLAYPCLYHDKGRKFMIYLVPTSSNAELGEVDVETAFPQLNCVKKRMVSSLAALKEKILIFEANLDDRAVELTKLALSGVLAKKSGQEPKNAYFSYADETNNRIGFAFFFEGEENPVQKTTQMEAYAKSLEITEQSSGSSCGFACVDSAFAQMILDEYQEN